MEDAEFEAWCEAQAEGAEEVALYEAWVAEQERMCRSEIEIGPRHDPYGAYCELDREHDGPHQSSDPFGGDDVFRWTGGGYCAGDPLPFRVVAP